MLARIVAAGIMKGNIGCLCWKTVAFLRILAAVALLLPISSRQKDSSIAVPRANSLFLDVRSVDITRA